MRCYRAHINDFRTTTNLQWAEWVLVGTDVFSYSGMSDNIKGQWAQYDQCTGGVWWWSHDAANERAREETGSLIYYCVYQRELQRMRLNVNDCLNRYVSDLTVLFFKIRMWCWIVHQVVPRSSEWSGEECGHQPETLQRRRRRWMFILSCCVWSFTQYASNCWLLILILSIDIYEHYQPGWILTGGGCGSQSGFLDRGAPCWLEWVGLIWSYWWHHGPVHHSFHGGRHEPRPSEIMRGNILEWPPDELIDQLTDQLAHQSDCSWTC